jgi:hypothetical protein
MNTHSLGLNHRRRSTGALPLGLLCGAVVSACLADNYQSIVQGDGPLAYYRLADTLPVDTAVNSGSIGAAGNGIHVGVAHRTTGAIVATGNAAAGYNGSGARTFVPFNATLNPAASKPFTIEAWVMPTIDGLGNAQAPLFNRHSAGNRQGWVFFQRASGTGFNFRMYNQNGSTQSIDITGGPYTVGAWTHLVAVWDGATATLYVNGANVGSQTAGYVANTDAPFSIGAYGADNPGDNPFTGSIDEVAFYTNALTAIQILNHYNNGNSPTPATPYSTVVLTDGAVEYLHLDEPDPALNVAVNSGNLGPAADGFHFPGAFHQVSGALAGVADTAIGYWAIDTNSDDGGVPTVIPYNAALNTSGSFTIEAWLKPTEEGAGNAQCPLFNCQASTENYGWDFYQRASTTGTGQHGFEFYMNAANGSRVADAVGGTYTIGQWTHLVAVYDSVAATATLYVNGLPVALSTGISGYAPNPSFPLSFGGYSDGTQNPFVGSIDEVALYPSALPAAKVLAHYQNGTNAARVTPYDSLVTSDGAAGYWRLDEPARAVAANLGTLGSAINATYVNTSNILAGPQSPAFVGFETNNLAAPFNGVNSYIELGNPNSLNFSGAITLEAWIQPAALQNSESYIIAHGYNDSSTAENVLRIENGNYQISSYNGTGHGTGFAVPPEDLGTTGWVYLAGTYDGANWNLYRNGILVATNADAIGALIVTNANWAIGARGKWKYASGYPTAGQDRQFTGGIDEAAIYNYALSPSRIAAHYSMGTYGPSPLTITHSGANVVLTWPSGTLQESTRVTGPYTNSVSVVSGVPFAPNGMKYYRVKF